MRKFSLMKSNALVFLIAGMLAAAPALAEKPSWAGGEKGDRGKHNDRHDKHSKQDHDSYDRDERGDGRHQHFGEQQRVVVREYYVEQYRKGRCPPGLAKKRNGCMPPGHAKKWKIGRPLPREVIYYDLPPAVVTRIGPPPSGHRYVRVASDILLIAIGTGMIVDAIEDLSR